MRTTPAAGYTRETEPIELSALENHCQFAFNENMEDRPFEFSLAEPAEEQSTDVEQPTDVDQSVSIRRAELPEIKMVPCDSCRSDQFLPLYEKKSGRGELFQIVRCLHCDLVQVNPQPNAAAVAPYYSKDYFTRRTDRGYDNYFSEQVKSQIQSVYDMNLNDLGFPEYETMLFSEDWIYRNLRNQNENPARQATAPRALDVGCAAGYFVQYMQDRGWKAQGIELSADAAMHGIRELNLDILIDDFLSCDRLREASYDLLTLWASLEHMHSPRQVLERSFTVLKPGGRMLLSTCRWGVLARMRGLKWRYLNVPEHLYFFSLDGLKELAAEIGFVCMESITYGSGMTTRANAGPLYRMAKSIADPLVKRTNQGDMMALHLMRPL